MTGTLAIDDKLFPAPSHDCHAPHNPSGPRTSTWPGVSAVSTTALREILTDNHRMWHVFFNDRGFHNHTAHAILTLWSLGAHESLLRSVYEEDSKRQRPAFASPHPVNRKNWKDHLGDENYYQAYCKFFMEELEHKSFCGVLEEYIFSNDANVIAGSNKENPRMMNRFFAGLFHPVIHTGLGLEFNLPGTFVEGLAMVAVSQAEATKLVPSSWWFTPSESLSSRFSSAVEIGGDNNVNEDVHAFTVLARVLADLAFIPTKVPYKYDFYAETVENLGDSIRGYVEQWTIEGDLQKKVEELIWTSVLIYGVGGSQVQASTFNAEFVHMHFVTSSVFLSGVFSRLKRSSQALFLRGYFAICLGWYIGRGRPALDIATFFKNPNTLLPQAQGVNAQPNPYETAQASPTSPHTVIRVPDPWLALMQSAFTYPDDHFPKLQRALSEHASRFSAVGPGAFVSTELKDAELINGSLFIRTAVLTENRLGWVRELGQPPSGGVWDLRGFYDSVASTL